MLARPAASSGTSISDTLPSLRTPLISSSKPGPMPRPLRLETYSREPLRPLGVVPTASASGYKPVGVLLLALLRLVFGVGAPPALRTGIGFCPASGTYRWRA